MKSEEILQKIDEALLQAIYSDNTKTVKELLANKGRGLLPNVNAKSIDGFSPLHYAADKGNKEIVQLLIDAGAKLNTLDTQGHTTPLYIAVYKGHKNAAKLLINAGADVNVKVGDDLRYSTLHTAAYQDDNIVQQLIDAGADVNATEAYGNTPLHQIVRRLEEGHETKNAQQIIEQLIAAGADPDVENNDGKNPRNLAQSTELTKYIEDIISGAVKAREDSKMPLTEFVKSLSDKLNDAGSKKMHGKSFVSLNLGGDIGQAYIVNFSNFTKKDGSIVRGLGIKAGVGPCIVTEEGAIINNRHEGGKELSGQIKPLKITQFEQNQITNALDKQIVQGNQEIKNETDSAITIQAAFRGHRARKEARKAAARKGKEGEVTDPGVEAPGGKAPEVIALGATGPGGKEDPEALVTEVIADPAPEVTAAPTTITREELNDKALNKDLLARAYVLMTTARNGDHRSSSASFRDFFRAALLTMDKPRHFKSPTQGEVLKITVDNGNLPTAGDIKEAAAKLSTNKIAKEQLKKLTGEELVVEDTYGAYKPTASEILGIYKDGKAPGQEKKTQDRIDALRDKSTFTAVDKEELSALKTRQEARKQEKGSANYHLEFGGIDMIGVTLDFTGDNVSNANFRGCTMDGKTTINGDTKTLATSNFYNCKGVKEAVDRGNSRISTDPREVLQAPRVWNKKSFNPAEITRATARSTGKAPIIEMPAARDVDKRGGNQPHNIAEFKKDILDHLFAEVKPADENAAIPKIFGDLMFKDSIDGLSQAYSSLLPIIVTLRNSLMESVEKNKDKNPYASNDLKCDVGDNKDLPFHDVSQIHTALRSIISEIGNRISEDAKKSVVEATKMVIAAAAAVPPAAAVVAAATPEAAPPVAQAEVTAAATPAAAPPVAQAEVTAGPPEAVVAAATPEAAPPVAQAKEVAPPAAAPPVAQAEVTAGPPEAAADAAQAKEVAPPAAVPPAAAVVAAATPAAAPPVAQAEVTAEAQTGPPGVIPAVSGATALNERAATKIGVSILV